MFNARVENETLKNRNLEKIINHTTSEIVEIKNKMLDKEVKNEFLRNKLLKLIQLKLELDEKKITVKSEM